ncbi:MAG: hypothetical protein ABUT20_64505, partial [Bacteroidota bacterium]
MNTAFSANIKAAGFKKYTYHDIVLGGTLNDGVVKSNGHINDTALKLQYDLSANVKEKYPTAVEANIQIDTIQLKKLNLYKDSLDIAGHIYIKAPNLDPEQADLYAAMDSMKINLRNKNYFFDSIITKANTVNGINT